MKRRLVALVACVVLAIAALTACSTTQGSDASNSSSAAASKSASYTETDLSLLSSVEGAPSTLTVRFYEDMPSVPYIGFAKYMSLVYGDEAKVEVKDGVATITATDGGVAVVDDAADMLSSDSWGTFHNYIEPMQQGKVQGLIDFGAPFMRIASLDYEKQAAPVVFDFAKYNIDIHVGEDDAYLPIATASDLMSDTGMNNLAYNGEKLALLHGLTGQAVMLDPAWYTLMGNGEPRAQDMTDFAYNELCFAMDTLYSCSGKGAIDEDVKAKGFDATMSSKDDFTKRVQELLKSTDKIEYAMGLELLGYCVYNGHVGLVDGTFQGTAVAQNEELAKQMEQIRTEVWPLVEQLGYTQYMMQAAERQAKQAQQQRDQIWTDGETYHEQGDTAVISIDSYFRYDEEGWTAYLAGTGERPDGKTVEDTVGTLLAGLERAKANPKSRTSYSTFPPTAADPPTYSRRRSVSCWARRRCPCVTLPAASATPSSTTWTRSSTEASTLQPSPNNTTSTTPSSRAAAPSRAATRSRRSCTTPASPSSARHRAGVPTWCRGSSRPKACAW